jgi:hypothetical protein
MTHGAAMLMARMRRMEPAAWADPSPRVESGPVRMVRWAGLLSPWSFSGPSEDGPRG